MKRWLIRCFFFALLVVCAAVWVGSYWRGATIQHDGKTWERVYCYDGRIAFFHDLGSSYGWHGAYFDVTSSTRWNETWDRSASFPR